MRGSTQLALNSQSRSPALAETSQFNLHSVASPERASLQNYIYQQFMQAHGARVSTYLPLFLRMHEEGETEGVVGLNSGANDTMFLEHYLECPVEQAVAGAVGQPIDRCSLVEIGNLAVSHRGKGMMMFIIMTCALYEAGYQWMVFTATRQVEKLIVRLNFQPDFLATATAEHLGEEGKDWGSYYALEPKVMVGNLASAASVLRENPRLQHLLDTYNEDIRWLASSLRDHKRAVRGIAA